MKTIPQKHRAEIYLAAAERAVGGEGGCWAIVLSANLGEEYEFIRNKTDMRVGEYVAKKGFDEFQLFNTGYTWWFENFESRTIALLLCHQMAINP